MIEPISEIQKNKIIKNVLAACVNIDKLNKTGYDFLYQAIGFIAHYNIEGFKGYYLDRNLRAEILYHEPTNQYLNFHPKDRYYAYYRSKAAIYKKLAGEVRKMINTTV